MMKEQKSISELMWASSEAVDLTQEPKVKAAMGK